MEHMMSNCQARSLKSILLLAGSLAMIQEGVNFSLEMMTPGGDAQWIAAMSMPRPLLFLTGSFLLVAGVKTISLLLPLTDIVSESPFKDKFLIVLLGMSSLMLIRFIHSVVASPGSVVENLVPLIFSLLLAVFVALSYKPASGNIGGAGIKTESVAWSAVTLALTLGLGKLLIRLILLN